MAGEIATIELQPKFILQEGFRSNGKKYQPITYIADFQLGYSDGSIEIIDTKGYRTKEYQLKKKLLLFKYPNINFKEV